MEGYSRYHNALSSCVCATPPPPTASCLKQTKGDFQAYNVPFHLIYDGEAFMYTVI